ncbi:MAG: hypothetical protein WCC12_18530, partial [Anaerolineales bacterium]
MEAKKVFSWFAASILIVTLFGAIPAAAAPQTASALPAFQAQSGNFSEPTAFDVSPALSDLAAEAASVQSAASEEVLDIRPDRGPAASDSGFSGDAAIQGESLQSAFSVSSMIPAP